MSAPIAACPFCDYKGPSAVLARYGWGNDQAIVFEPLNPVARGHVLAVPTRHIETPLEDSLAAYVAGATMNHAASYAREQKLSDCNFILSAGEAATQTVKHLHVHVVPRREGDGLMLPWTRS